MTERPPFADPAVARAFDGFAPQTRAGLLALRRMIFDVARETQGVGTLHETLKWGQPAYLTPETKSGSTLRLGAPKQGGCAIYAHCQTTIIADFRDLFPDEFAYDGTRAVLLSGPDDRLRLLIANALTYHAKRKTAAPS